MIQGIGNELSVEEKLDMLMKNFLNIGFTYNGKQSKAPESFLQGDLTGDCNTLVMAFKLVAERGLNIQGIELQSQKDGFLVSQSIQGPHIAGTPNCDNGQRWFFNNHHWVEYNGQVYDPLLQVRERLEMDRVVNDNQESIFMPLGEYHRTERGTIVYLLRDYSWSTTPLSLFEKISNAFNNLKEDLKTRKLPTIKKYFQKNDISGLEEWVERNRSLQEND